MILPKEVVEISRGPNHCLKINHVIYGIFDVVRQNILHVVPRIQQSSDLY